MAGKKAAWDKFIMKMNELDISESVIQAMQTTEELKELLVAVNFNAIDKAQVLSEWEERSNLAKRHAYIPTPAPKLAPKPSSKLGFGNRMVSDDVTQTKELPPTNLFPNNFHPSRPAHETLQELQIPNHNEIIEWCMRHVEESEDAAKKYNLTPDEVLSIVLYTYDLGVSFKPEDNIYFRLNHCLRTRSATLGKWRDYLWYLLNALQKLPEFKGEVYRGINAKLVMASYGKGKQIRWSALTSTSKSREVAVNFMAAKHADPPYLFVLDVTRGRLISEFSAVPDEAEVLLLPESSFSVMYLIDYGSPPHIITMQQAAPPATQTRTIMHTEPSQKAVSTLPSAPTPTVKISPANSSSTTTVTQPNAKDSQFIQNKFEQVDMVTTFAGSIEGNKDGNGAGAQFANPRGICFNPNDQCFYICDSNTNTIRKMTLQGDVSTLAQSAGKQLEDIAVYHKDNTIFVANWNSIVKISLSSGLVETIAGERGISGSQDRVISNERFSSLKAITIEQKTGIIFAADNNLIRMVTQKGEVFTLAGLRDGYQDGSAKDAKFRIATGICFNEADKSLFVCDYGNNRIRRVSYVGEVSTVCEVDMPRSIKTLPDGNFLISSYQNKLFRLTRKGGGKYELQHIAGYGKKATIDGTASECCFSTLHGIAVHEPSKTCFVTEFYGHVVRRITFK